MSGSGSKGKEVRWSGGLLNQGRLSESFDPVAPPILSQPHASPAPVLSNCPPSPQVWRGYFPKKGNIWHGKHQAELRTGHRSENKGSSPSGSERTRLVSMRMWFNPWPRSVGGVGGRRRLDLAWLWLWLWHRPVAIGPVRPLAWEPPYALGVALKSKKKTRE